MMRRITTGVTKNSFRLKGRDVNKKKLLVLPSWYISPEDRINGSFFREQAIILSEKYDTRVLVQSAQGRPSIRKLLRDPFNSLGEWVEYVKTQHQEVALPDEEEFNHPKLCKYISRRPLTFKAPPSDWLINEWLERIDEMICSGWQPDIIQAHSVVPAGIVARRAKERHRIPYVITEHMPFTIFKYHERDRAEIKSAFMEANRVLSLSYDKVRQLAMSDIDVEPHIIYNYVDDSRFTGLAAGYSQKRPLKLVTVGAASFYKDHKTLLRAMRAALDLGVSLHLTMIGLKVYGSCCEETIDFIRDMDLSDSVSMVDKVSREEVAKLLPAFDVFVMTSIQEGFPVSVLEALASGLFVIATRHGGTEDLLTEDVGRLVSIKQHQEIARILKKIYEGRLTFDPATIREFAIKNCGRDEYLKRLSDHYEYVLNAAN